MQNTASKNHTFKTYARQESAYTMIAGKNIHSTCNYIK